MAVFFVILFAGTTLGLALSLWLVREELRFEREWREEEEAQHEKWFRIAVGDRDK